MITMFLSHSDANQCTGVMCHLDSHIWVTMTIFRDFFFLVEMEVLGCSEVYVVYRCANSQAFSSLV